MNKYFILILLLAIHCGIYLESGLFTVFMMFIFVLLAVKTNEKLDQIEYKLRSRDTE